MRGPPSEHRCLPTATAAGDVLTRSRQERGQRCVAAVLVTMFGLFACGNAVTPTATESTVSLACSSSTAALGRVTPAGATVTVGGSPFSMLPIPGTAFAVASVTTTGQDPHGQLEVLQVDAGTESLLRSIVLPATTGTSGMALSHDNRWLAVTTSDNSTLLVSVAGVLAGVADPILGRLNDGASGQIEAAFSMDDEYLFVTDEDSDQLSVFNIARAVASGFTSGDAVGRVLLSAGPVGIAISDDGRWVYVTTEGPNGGPGFLWVLDEHIATQDPDAAIVSHIGAGCNPVRVALSPDGEMAWVTARASDALAGFNTADLRSQPSRALVAVVRVGLEPVGLALYDDGDYAVVANSARFVSPGAPQTLTVVNLAAASTGRGAIMTWIAAGAFPREVAIDGSFGLVTNYGSRTVEAFRLPTSTGS